MRARLPEWLDEVAPAKARGTLAANGAIDLLLGGRKVAAFLPTSVGLSIYLYGSSDTEVKRIERLCDRAGVPEETRPPRTSKYVLIKVKDDETLKATAEALRLHCIGRA